MIRTTLPVAVFVAATTLACSSNTTINNAPACAPGTLLVDGVCQVADAAAADTIAADTQGDTTSADAPETTVDAAGDASKDSVVDAFTGDPCPSKEIYVNCAKDCGGPNALCKQTTCRKLDPLDSPLIITKDKSEFPLVLRTPDKPGVDPNCQPRCGAGNTVYGMAFDLKPPPGAPPYAVRVKVGPPWKIGVYRPFQPYCAAGDEVACFEGNADSMVQIVTTDPEAPARNITVEVDVLCK